MPSSGPSAYLLVEKPGWEIDLKPLEEVVIVPVPRRYCSPTSRFVDAGSAEAHRFAVRAPRTDRFQGACAEQVAERVCSFIPAGGVRAPAALATPTAGPLDHWIRMLSPGPPS